MLRTYRIATETMGGKQLNVRPIFFYLLITLFSLALIGTSLCLAFVFFAAKTYRARNGYRLDDLEAGGNSTEEGTQTDDCRAPQGEETEMQEMPHAHHM